MKKWIAVCLLPVFAVAAEVKNPAVAPVPKLEQDGYDWYARHQAVVETQAALNPQVVLVGDSITHFWGGLPADKKNARGAAVFSETFGDLRVLNLGFGWDRTQNVLWRLENGELDGLSPALIFVHIGTNNTSATRNARANSPAEIAEGIGAVCAKLAEKAPGARIVLFDIFPREQHPDHPRRTAIREANRLLGEIKLPPQVIRMNLDAALEEPDGSLSRAVMGDFCHPSAEGYRRWSAAIKPLLAAYFPKNPAPPREK